jgi:hypothetical protein
MEQVLDQMLTVKEEKNNVNQVQVLETNLAEMKNQLGKSLPPQPPAGPSEAEQLLQAEAQQLQKELKDLAAQLQAQVSVTSA